MQSRRGLRARATSCSTSGKKCHASSSPTLSSCLAVTGASTAGSVRADAKYVEQYPHRRRSVRRARGIPRCWWKAPARHLPTALLPALRQQNAHVASTQMIGWIPMTTSRRDWSAQRSHVTNHLIHNPMAVLLASQCGCGAFSLPLMTFPRAHNLQHYTRRAAAEMSRSCLYQSLYHRDADLCGCITADCLVYIVVKIVLFCCTWFVVSAKGRPTSCHLVSCCSELNTNCCVRVMTWNVHNNLRNTSYNFIAG